MSFTSPKTWPCMVVNTCNMKRLPYTFLPFSHTLAWPLWRNMLQLLINRFCLEAFSELSWVAYSATGNWLKRSSLSGLADGVEDLLDISSVDRLSFIRQSSKVNVSGWIAESLEGQDLAGFSCPGKHSSQHGHCSQWDSVTEVFRVECHGNLILDLCGSRWSLG